MAIEENNKKPDRAKRYRKLYNAYRDETDGQDDEFWSSLEADTGSVQRTLSDEKISAGEDGAKRRDAVKRSRPVPDSVEAEPNDSGKRRIDNRKKKAQERKLKRGRRFYIAFLVLWVIVLICCGIWLWRYTGRCLEDYEKSQPENNVDRLLQEFVAKVRNGTIVDEFAYFKETDEWKLPSEFENENYFKDQYISKLENVKEYTCVKNKNSYSTTNPVYDILGDGEVVAQMRITSYNPRKILAILEVCDWKVDSFTQVLNIDGDNLNTTDYVYTVPEGYKITVNGRELTQEYVVKTSEIPKELEYVKDYVKIPVNVTYKICQLLNRPEVTVTDDKGNPVSAAFDDKGCLDIQYEPKTGLEPPQERYDLSLLTAQKWMDFVTDDLSGKYHGLDEIRKYLLKDSLFYVKSEEYGKGIDIKFISSHTIDNPEYTELAVTNYTEYTESCFSIHVYFIKHMRLVKGNKREVKSIFDSTLYFIYYDDTDDGTDNPHWTLCDMIAGARQSYGNEDE